MCTMTSDGSGTECIFFTCRFVSACPANCLKCTENAGGSGTECMDDQCVERYALKDSDKTCIG